MTLIWNPKLCFDPLYFPFSVNTLHLVCLLNIFSESAGKTINMFVLIAENPMTNHRSVVWRCDLERKSRSKMP